MVTHPHSLTGALVLCAFVGFVHQTDDDAPAQASESTETAEQPLPALPQPDAAPIRGQLDGHAFPDGVLALTWDEGMTAGRGFIAIALVIFAKWNPLWALAGAFVFGIEGDMWCGERHCPAGTHIELPFGAADGARRRGP